MARSWEGELEFIAAFARDLQARPTLQESGAEDLAAHAEQVAHLQDLLSLIASVAPKERPPVVAWDDVLGPFWRRLYAKGDDVTRYILADLWRGVLLDAGELDRYFRSTAGVVASARNFYRFEEALAACNEAASVATGDPSAAYANLLNTQGSVHLCMGNHLDAELCYGAALEMGLGTVETDLASYPGVSRDDFVAQEKMNILEVWIRGGHEAQPKEREKFILKARSLLEDLEASRCSASFQRIIEVHRAEIFMLEGRLAEAAAALLTQRSGESQEGPYAFSMSAMNSRLLSKVAALNGDWGEAYRWIRLAMKEGTTRAYPLQDQFVLEQAIAVLRGLHKTRDLDSEERLVRDLSLLLEDKDWYTGRSHSRSVGRLATCLGKTLNQTKGWDLDMEILSRAGLLHDIGKLRVPWSLLNKIAPITPKEWSLLRDHSLHGADLLSAMGMGIVGEVVLQHHEAMDGTGYPYGKAPDRMASVVAVCDVYEASVTPNRRYKVPKDSDAAIWELRNGSGQRYQGEVVEALAGLLSRGEIH